MFHAAWDRASAVVFDALRLHRDVAAAPILPPA